MPFWLEVSWLKGVGKRIGRPRPILVVDYRLFGYFWMTTIDYPFFISSNCKSLTGYIALSLFEHSGHNKGHENKNQGNLDCL